MPPNFGTRTRRNVAHERVSQSRPNSVTTRDVGMTKLISASITFGSGQLLAANNTFTSFAVGDGIVVENAPEAVCGFYTVTGIDVISATYLIVDPPPQAAGPVSATVRTP